MAHIAKGYTVLQLDEAVARFQQHSLPPYALAITFDDGYRNFYDHALPILKEHNLPATVFLTTDFVLRSAPLWVDRLEYAVGQVADSLSHRQLRDDTMRAELKKVPSIERERVLSELESGCIALRDFSEERAVYAPVTPHMVMELSHNMHVSIGAHTCSHPILSTLARGAAEREILQSKRDLAELVPNLSPVFAYPNGQPNDYTSETISILRDAGFTAALTTTEGFNSAGTPPYEMKRITLDGTENADYFLAALTGLRSAVRRLKTYA